jgi:DNA-binding transcriptional LysR family regulator
VVCRAANLFEATTFRFLDLAPDQIIPVGLRNGFEMAVHFGALAWPGTWSTQSLGKSRWVLCARHEHPLSKRPGLAQILEFPFVVPTYWTADGLVRGNDQFPIDIKKRKMGFETATADAAVPILLETDHLAFLPNLLVRPFIDRKLLREIRATDLPMISRELFLTVKADAVPAKAFATLASALSASLR